MKKKTFSVNKPTDLPTVWNDRLQISFNYLAIAKNSIGQPVNTIAIYDFKKQKWIFSNSAAVELIEYYS